MKTQFNLTPTINFPDKPATGIGLVSIIRSCLMCVERRSYVCANIADGVCLSHGCMLSPIRKTQVGRKGEWKYRYRETGQVVLKK